MKLTGVRHYLSITPFQEVELPALVVLTGVNGSGKSQLLEAIVQGAVVTDVAGNVAPPQVNTKIVRISNGMGQMASFGPAQSKLMNPLGPVNPIAEGSFEDNHYQVLLKAFQLLSKTMGDRMSAVGRPTSALWRAGPEAFIANFSPLEEHEETVRAVFDLAETAFSHDPSHGPVVNQFIGRVGSVAEKLGIPRLQVTEAALFEVNRWGQFSAFSPNITELFAAYRDARVTNDLARIEAERRGSRDFLSHEEFVTEFGAPPWETINDVLETFGLGYRVVEPDFKFSNAVTFELERLDNQAKVSPDALSSGEKVLLQFALALFPYDPLRTTAAMPSLLLLDEMDASLHPEMVNRWLVALDALVRDFGISCILTTHSPTTVALAPSGSLFESSLGGGAPREVTKQQALNRLTFGVPTLSVDFEGRRQVFVESDTDADSYEILASQMKGRLSLLRTLTFLSTGIRNGKGEVGTGCTVVRKLVRELTESGNKSVFGILDWDQTNEPESRIIVVGHGSHYALDNLLLDPILVGALILREKTTLPGFSGTFTALGALGASDLQVLVDLVQTGIVYPGQDSSFSKSAYVGGLTLQVRTTHMTMNGHDLEDLLVMAHPVLNKFAAGGRGKLTGAIVRNVLRDYPDFCPTPIANAFRRLANDDVD